MATSWNITLNDTSPVFTYYPYYDGFGLTNGWQIWYSETGYNTAPANPGYGISAHITSLPGANFTLSFYGTGIELHGTANCTFDITVDGVFSSTLTSASDVLYSQQTLSGGTHALTLTAHPTSGQQLAFESAVIFVNQTTPQMESYSNTNTTFLNYAGNWTTGTDAHVPGGTFHYTETMESTVSTSFSGSSAVVVQGIVNWGNWQYAVSLNGTQSVLNASSFWFIPDTTLFYEGGLDPEQTYVLNITDTSEDGNKLALNSVMLYQQTSTLTPASSSKSSNIGAIAGSVSAVIVILALAIGFGFWRYSRRPKAIRSGREFNVLANEITPQAHSARFPALFAEQAISGRNYAKKFPVAPIGGNTDDLVLHREREMARGPASVTSSLGLYSEPRNATSGSLSSPSTHGQRRPLPPPPDSDLSTALPLMDMHSSPRPSAQELQIPDSEVDRILEIIASRIDIPEGNSTYPPPYRR
ncbi:hypothetical protein K503DRAFT_767082 [Rhizopogon vinicolor AM-OR11-026]|uniref:Uncharacterized protein n=1 Tax=Rhizopogon vinicolor AM-OR11-026 TaxID=1314800 RepID=A0A1B7NB42_9AGAM|nr:hypothetical protein K503DRAFT_767082 [Rhizopogon vinicolor AM-OR11-026]